MPVIDGSFAKGFCDVPDDSIKIRNYSDDDFERYLKLQVESAQLGPERRYVSARTLKDDLGRPNFNPQTDLWVADLDEKMVGSLSITREPEIGRALIGGCVHPLHRRKGIATRLLTNALQSISAGGIPVAQVSIPQADTAAKNLLKRMNFTFIRYFLEMRLAIDRARVPAIHNDTTTSRRLGTEETHLLTEIQNRCFADTWGFNPNTEDEIAYRLKMQSHSPQDVILTYQDDHPVGYCWTIMKAAENANRKEKIGLIHMLGVDPDYRQQDIGKVILCNGLNVLKANGVNIVELTVDSENSAARSLYALVGFKVYAKTEWYERVLSEYGS